MGHCVNWNVSVFLSYNTWSWN